MNNFIKIENITKKYEKNKTIKVLNDVSFNFESGKIYSIVGSVVVVDSSDCWIVVTGASVVVVVSTLIVSSDVVEHATKTRAINKIVNFFMCLY